MKHGRPIPMTSRETLAVKRDGRTRYRIKYAGQVYVRTFTQQWYGPNFEGVYQSGVQYDPPDENSSEWQGIWGPVR